MFLSPGNVLTSNYFSKYEGMVLALVAFTITSNLGRVKEGGELGLFKIETIPRFSTSGLKNLSNGG
jgi:hypothetical protein